MANLHWSLTATLFKNFQIPSIGEGMEGVLLEWAIPENIRTIPRTASWNSEGKGGFFELEFRRHGGDRKSVV